MAGGCCWGAFAALHGFGDGAGVGAPPRGEGDPLLMSWATARSSGGGGLREKGGCECAPDGVGGDLATGRGVGVTRSGTLWDHWGCGVLPSLVGICSPARSARFSAPEPRLCKLIAGFANSGLQCGWAGRCGEGVPWERHPKGTFRAWKWERLGECRCRRVQTGSGEAVDGVAGRTGAAMENPAAIGKWSRACVSNFDGVLVDGAEERLAVTGQ